MDFRTREQQAAFERCVGFLAEMIEKYSHVLDFPSSLRNKPPKLGQKY